MKTGRHQSSLEAKTSRFSKSDWPRKVAPCGTSLSTCTRLPVGSHENAQPSYSASNFPPDGQMRTLHAAVNDPTCESAVVILWLIGQTRTPSPPPRRPVFTVRSLQSCTV